MPTTAASQNMRLVPLSGFDSFDRLDLYDDLHTVFFESRVQV